MSEALTHDVHCSHITGDDAGKGTHGQLGHCCPQERVPWNEHGYNGGMRALNVEAAHPAGMDGSVALGVILST